MPWRAANRRARSGSRAATASTIAPGTRRAGRTSAMRAAPRMPKRSAPPVISLEPRETRAIPMRHPRLHAARASRPGPRLSSAGGGKELRHDDAGREDLLGERARRPRGGVVVGLDGRERLGGLADVVEEAQPRACREMRLRPRRLHDARPAAREVADGAVAHPAGARLHVGRLGAGELAARALYVGAKRLR